MRALDGLLGFLSLVISILTIKEMLSSRSAAAQPTIPLEEDISSDYDFSWFG